MSGEELPGVMRQSSSGKRSARASVRKDAGNPASRRRLETRILHVEQEHWRGYTYVWNDDQTDADLLEDHRRGTAWQKPVHEDGRDIRSRRYQVRHAAGLLAALAEQAAASDCPVTTNPCGEIVLHVTGGYCVIADYAPLLACPAPLDSFPCSMPGRMNTAMPPAVASTTAAPAPSCSHRLRCIG